MKVTRWRTTNDTDDQNELAAIDGYTVCEEPSLTRQEFAENADLNVVLKRMGVTDGAQLPANMEWGSFDLTEFTEMEEVTLEAIMRRNRDAEDQFNKLPADMRARFDNSPHQLWRFITNPQNADEAIELGFLKRLDPPAEPAENVPPSP